MLVSVWNIVWGSIFPKSWHPLPCPRTYPTQASAQRSCIGICRYCLSNIAVCYRYRILLPCILGPRVSHPYYTSSLQLFNSPLPLSLWAALTQLLPMQAISKTVSLHHAETHILCRFAIYPLLKRVTHWPQAWLGIAMNFGFITAWMSLTSSSTVSNIPLVAVVMAGCWWSVTSRYFRIFCVHSTCLF